MQSTSDDSMQQHRQHKTALRLTKSIQITHGHAMLKFCYIWRYNVNIITLSTFGMIFIERD